MRGICKHCGLKTPVSYWTSCNECDRKIRYKRKKRKVEPLKEKVVIKIKDVFGEFNPNYKPEIKYMEAKGYTFLRKQGYSIKEEFERDKYKISTILVDKLGVVIGYKLME